MHSSALPHRRFNTHRDPEAAQAALDEADAAELVEADKVVARREALYLAGRLIVAGVFLVSALVKAMAFDSSQSGSLGGVFWLSVLLEVACGVLLAAGLFARRAALVLLLWLGVGIIFFHGDLTLEVNRVFALAN